MERTIWRVGVGIDREYGRNWTSIISRLAYRSIRYRIIVTDRHVRRGKISKIRYRVKAGVRVKRKRNNMNNMPHAKGYCMRVFQQLPKKPNSAKRWVARIWLFRYRKKIVAKIGGKGRAGLERFKKVLVRGGTARDLIGVKNVVVRGVYTARCENYTTRLKKRSKYGLKNYDKYLRDGRLEQDTVSGEDKRKVENGIVRKRIYVADRENKTAWWEE